MRAARALTAVFVVTHAAPLAAQAGLGHLEDASTAPKGLLRLRAITAWTRYDARFTATGDEPLGAFLTANALGSAQLPSLASLESRVASASGAPFALSLGRSRLDATGREEIVPVTFEYGLTNRLSVTAMLPVIRKRVAVQFIVDTAGGFANVGPNPHRSSTLAQFTNGQVESQFLAARTLLEQRLAQCAANSSQPQCASVNGREAQATQLLQDAQRFATDVAVIYGNQSSTGSAFVPATGSAAQDAILQRVASFNTQFQDYLGSSSSLLTASPVGAGGPAGHSDLQRYLADELGRDSILFREKVFVGDWELSAKFRAVDRPETETRRLAMQLAVAGGVRFASGTRHSNSDIVDLRTGTGKVALTSRAILDARFARLGVLASADLAVAVAGGDTSAGASRDSRWTELHIAPRWHLSQPFAVYAAYSMRSADKSGGDQLVGGGVSFTTLERWSGRTLPWEMRYTHLEAVSGDAGRPRFFRDQLEVRLYFRRQRR